MGHEAGLAMNGAKKHDSEMQNRADDGVAYFARTNFRGKSRLVGISLADRRHHMLILGKTGTGKSTLIETLVKQDIEVGMGVALLDPHGDLVERVVAEVPPQRRDDLIYFNVPDTARPLGFNPLEPVPSARRPLAASGMLEVFKKLWPDSWGPRLEHILRNALLVLLDQPQATLADVLRLLDDKTFRKNAAGRARSSQVRAFWLREYENYPARFKAEAIAPVQNKVGAFLSDPTLCAILTQPHSSLDLRRVMDDGKILLVNLAKGRLGEDSAALLGALLVSRIGFAALSRADVAEHKRRDFFLYLDEFPTFTTLSLASMLSELRKYRTNLAVAAQYLGQAEDQVRDAILGNVGTIVTFRVGLGDAEVLEKESCPEFKAEDLVSLPNHNIYTRVMIDGKVSRPFSAETLPRSEDDRTPT
jgi:hypothetical protein